MYVATGRILQACLWESPGSESRSGLMLPCDFLSDDGPVIGSKTLKSSAVMTTRMSVLCCICIIRGLGCTPGVRSLCTMLLAGFRGL